MMIVSMIYYIIHEGVNICSLLICQCNPLYISMLDESSSTVFIPTVDKDFTMTTEDRTH